MRHMENDNAHAEITNDRMARVKVQKENDELVE